MNRTEANLKIAQQFLNSEEMDYFIVDGNRILMYLPGMILKWRKRTDSLRAGYVNVMIEASEHGLMMTLRIPLGVKTGSKEEEDRILDMIMEENTDRLFGGLLYDCQKGMLIYRTFMWIDEKTDALPAVEMQKVLEVSRRTVVEMHFRVYAMLHNKQIEQDLESNPAENAQEAEEDANVMEQNYQQIGDRLMALLDSVIDELADELDDEGDDVSYGEEEAQHVEEDG